MHTHTHVKRESTWEEWKDDNEEDMTKKNQQKLWDTQRKSNKKGYTFEIEVNISIDVATVETIRVRQQQDEHEIWAQKRIKA